ncbi:YraN family protein [Acetobacter sp.]|jgi:putative endonuclease|uniref:YraN family protein n=1 Tax=Acetobacter sp. TaxID=440 RepID=UPI0025C6FB0B|nr:YraN family protein [Acetobacter sp.]MCH4089843.1 YraN family protein [Acetobacter sp.]MCI1298539.1 YraN family protein [Acetobacter sp.]MCI1315104.1 YraN family protein [Acetobacter sp.]
MQKHISMTRRPERGLTAWQQGVKAEFIAEQALVSHGWRILLRRARTPLGEIDLVALKAGELSFIEVKKRATYSHAAESISERQRSRIMDAAEVLLATHPEWIYETVVFDVILVDGTGVPRRIRSAFWQS